MDVMRDLDAKRLEGLEDNDDNSLVCGGSFQGDMVVGDYAIYGFEVVNRRKVSFRYMCVCPSSLATFFEGIFYAVSTVQNFFNWYERPIMVNIVTSTQIEMVGITHSETGAISLFISPFLFFALRKEKFDGMSDNVQNIIKIVWHELDHLYNDKNVVGLPSIEQIDAVFDLFCSEWKDKIEYTSWGIL